MLPLLWYPTILEAGEQSAAGAALTHPIPLPKVSLILHTQSSPPDVAPYPKSGSLKPEKGVPSPQATWIYPRYERNEQMDSR